MNTKRIDEKVADIYIKEAFAVLNQAETEYICAGLEDVQEDITPKEARQIWREIKHRRRSGKRRIPWRAAIAAILVAVVGVSFWAGAASGLFQYYYLQFQSTLNSLVFQSEYADVGTPDGRPSRDVYEQLQQQAPDIDLVIADELPTGTELIKADYEGGEIRLIYHLADDTYLAIAQHPAGSSESCRLPLQGNSAQAIDMQILGDHAAGAKLTMQNGAEAYCFIWANSSKPEQPPTEYCLTYCGHGKHLEQTDLSKVINCLKYFS